MSISSRPLAPRSKGPQLVEHRYETRSRYALVELWHLLSLDAPTVAALWTAFIGWAAGVRTPLVQVAGMFLAVWILYAGDRLLDARPLFLSASAPYLEERHRFHHRHRQAFIAAAACATFPLILALHRTADPVLHLFLLLAVLLGLWLLLVHAGPAASTTSHRLPKEFAVGAFFPAAVFIPTVGRVPALRPALLPAALVFAALCTLNCLYLFAWEHPERAGHAHGMTRWAVRHLFLLTSFTILAAALAAAATTSRFRPATSLLPRSLPHPCAPLLACLLSAACFPFLHRNRLRFTRLRLRALADLVLLSPLPIVCFLRLVQAR